MQSPQLMDGDDDDDDVDNDDALYTGITQAQAVEIVMQLKGHFKSVASLRLPSDVCLTIAIQIKKVGDSEQCMRSHSDDDEELVMAMSHMKRYY